MNNDEVEKNIIEAIEILGKTIYESHKILEDRISNIVNLLILKENEKKPKTATNHRGNSTVGPGIIKKRPNAKKLSVNGKIPDSYKISGTACKYCQGTVAWAPFKKPSDLGPDEKREPPIHCDENGNIKGDGRCPNF